MTNQLLILLLTTILCNSCSLDQKTITPNLSKANLLVKFEFSGTLPRLDNFGEEVALPFQHCGQTPEIIRFSVNHIELLESPSTPLGQGLVLYTEPKAVNNSVNFDLSKKGKPNETFTSLPQYQLKPGTYNYIRVNMGHIEMLTETKIDDTIEKTTFLGFLGEKTLLFDLWFGDQILPIHTYKDRGFWVLQTLTGLMPDQISAHQVSSPNPLHEYFASPTSRGYMTGTLQKTLVVTGLETRDQILTIQLSTNQLFEWIDKNENNIFEPALGDEIFDFGFRYLGAAVE